MPNPYLAIPTSDGSVDIRTVGARDSFRMAFPNHLYGYTTCSLLAYGFNILYCDALNKAKVNGLTHFVMLHSDVAPIDPPGTTWGERLMELMQEHNVGAMSVAVAIKDNSGDTSIGMDTDGKQRRLKFADIDGTITSRDHPGLLMNTGCLAIDLMEPWAEKLHFRIRDGILRNSAGMFEPFVHPEDWELSRMLADLGVPYGATTEINCNHVGKALWGRPPAPPEEAPKTTHTLTLKSDIPDHNFQYAQNGTKGD